MTNTVDQKSNKSRRVNNIKKLLYIKIIQTYYKVTIIKKMEYWCKDREMIQWNRIESLKKDSDICSSYDKGGTAVGKSLFRKRFWVSLMSYETWS